MKNNKKNTWLGKAAPVPDLFREEQAWRRDAEIAVKRPQTDRDIYRYAKKVQAIFKWGLNGVSAIFAVERHQGKIETGIFGIKSGFLLKIPAPFIGPTKRHCALTRRPGRQMYILKLSKRDSPVKSMLIFGDSKSKGGRHE
ncbi:MAG: hypothetical protein K9K21_02925 [Desulfotignum sp.]|nr:hypothetical protein [Desulfotignum sp.]